VQQSARLAVQLEPATGGAQWHVVPGARMPARRADGRGLRHHLDPLVCCYDIGFDDANGIVFYSTTVCFECDKPVPTERGTWGSLKARYR